MMNPKNSISQIKRLIGKQFSDPDLQRDLKSLPYTVTEGPNGYPLIQARYLGEVKAFTPTQVFAMMLSNMKEITEKILNAAVNDCCIGTPVYFTDFQRRAVSDAATIAGLNPLRLLHQTTATGLAMGLRLILRLLKELFLLYLSLGIRVDEKYWPLMPALPSCGYGKEGPGSRYSSLVHGQNPKDIVITEHHWYQVPILKFVERIPVEALFKSWMDMIQKIQNKASLI
ncbi:hypothetical protein KIW84_023048 [Lathyrus oleraceus]|uniref:Uncharacterized protein n=1 Tax=Pisum sativum TaxID=3888 RepID=A0A9D5B602_PEA|nr:hypothetical protein KIW84_023048 [Pisum sativum]